MNLPKNPALDHEKLEVCSAAVAKAHRALIDASVAIRETKQLDAHTAEEPVHPLLRYAPGATTEDGMKILLLMHLAWVTGSMLAALSALDDLMRQPDWLPVFDRNEQPVDKEPF